MRTDFATCLDPGGTRHSWVKAGVITSRGQLRRLRRCVWCHKSRTIPFRGED